MGTWQTVGLAIGAVAALVAVAGTVATWVVSSVRSSTTTLAVEIRGLARSMDELRHELQGQREMLREHDKAIAVLQTQSGGK